MKINFDVFFFFKGELIETEDAYNETDEVGEFEEEEVEEEEVKMIEIPSFFNDFNSVTFSV